MEHDQSKLIIGLMSGTSVDGIDAALVRFRASDQLNVIDTKFTPFPNGLRQRINNLAQSTNELIPEDYQTLSQELAAQYAQACLDLINNNNLSAQDIDAIANHGQTIRHSPDSNPPFSIQLGDNQQIADQTSITTIGQFRQDDLALGGQGAPLMPAFHKALLSNSNKHDRYILNIGGIANITCLNQPVIGFDTGPGNTLMDQWIQRHLKTNYDKDGSWAASGNVINSLLTQLLSTPYFSLPAPKSTGPDYFNLEWLERTLPDLHTHNPEDIQATLLALTVESIAVALDQISAKKGEVLICGGGSHNKHLRQQLAQRLPFLDFDTTNILGIPADWVESIGFAWLGYCHLQGITSNLPAVTGAREKVVLGTSYHPTTRLV